MSTVKEKKKKKDYFTEAALEVRQTPRKDLDERARKRKKGNEY